MKLRKAIGAIFLFSLLGIQSYAQNREVADSLLQVLSTLPADTHRVQVLNKLSFELQNSNSDTSLLLAKEAMALAQELNFQKGIAYAHNQFGDYLTLVGKYDSALIELDKCLALLDTVADIRKVGDTYSDIAIAHFFAGDYAEAAKFHLKALRVFEGINNQRGIASTFQNLGTLYFRMDNFETAGDYFEKCLEMGQSIPDSNTIASAYLNLGNVSFYEGEYEKTIDYFERAAMIWERAGDDLGASQTFNNLAVVSGQLGDLDAAIEYLNKSLAIKARLKDRKGLAAGLGNLAAIYSLKKDYDKAVQIGDSAMALSKDGGGLDAVMTTAKMLQDIHVARGDYASALEYARLYTVSKDSLFAAQSEEEIAGLQMKYENEKKEREIKQLQKEQKLADVARLENDAELAEQEANEQSARVRQKLFYGIIGGGVLVLLLVGRMLWRKLKRSGQLKEKQEEINQRTVQLQSANQEVNRQKNQIDSQNKALKDAHSTLTHNRDQLEEKNRDVMSSIRYAERIQLSMLPSRKKIKRSLTASFVFFKPKELVSGDFYWVEEVGDKVIFSAIDCTGHGVPGAFVSIVGNSGLHRVVNEMGHTQPAQIMDGLATYVEDIFAIKESLTEAATIKDGMDMALCTLDRKTKQLEYAGAYNALYIVRRKGMDDGGLTPKNETETHVLYEVRADRQPVGRFAARGAFTNHEIQLMTGDVLYLFSDGFADQFGGPKGKKYKYSAMRNLFLSFQDKPMEEQREILEETFEAWKGELEQVDDVIIMGVKV